MASWVCAVPSVNIPSEPGRPHHWAPPATGLTVSMNAFSLVPASPAPSQISISAWKAFCSTWRSGKGKFPPVIVECTLLFTSVSFSNIPCRST
eukprot:scaffold141120_cov15-Tisochrysis_lutea.AAC.1